MEQVRAIRLNKFGGFDSLEIANQEFNPLPASDQITVSIKACGVNFADIYTRQGLMPSFQLTSVLGLEACGIIEAIGNEVTDLKVGDRVLVHTGDHGLFCDKVKVHSRFCTLLPSTIGFEEGVALCINYLTAYFSIVKIGKLSEGETILISSAAGGVGWAATQLARIVDKVKVIGLASSHKHAAMLQNGVDVCIDSSDDIISQIHAAAPEGIDLIVDSYGGIISEKLHSLLKPLGRRVVIGASSFIGSHSINHEAIANSTGQINTVDLIMGNTGLHGFNLTTLLQASPREYKSALATIFSLYEGKRIVPKIDSVFAFTEVIEAQKRLSERKNIGKVILVPNKQD